MRVRFAWLIEGVRLEGPVCMGPLSLSPVPLERGYQGREAREIFNSELADAGFVTAVERPIWGAQTAPYRRLVTVIRDEIVIDDVSAILGTDALVARAADLLVVIWGGAPEVIAGATEVWDERAAGWRTLSVSVGGGPWQSSLVRKLLPEDAHLADDDPGELWTTSGEDPRVMLWLSLFRGLAADRAWDRRIFRACSLLETIASEIAPPRTELLGEDGEVLRDREGKAATTESNRGKIYWTLQQALRGLALPIALLTTHPSQTLWSEVGVWYDVRNSVAHEGYWPPPPMPARHPARRDEVAEAFAVAGRGDGLASGWLRYADTACAAVEVVLRAALKALSLTSPEDGAPGD